MTADHARVSPSTWYDFYLQPARAGEAIGEGAYQLLVDLMCHADSDGETFVGVERLASRQLMSRKEARGIIAAAERGGFLARTGEMKSRSHVRLLTLPAVVVETLPVEVLVDDLALSGSATVGYPDVAIFHRYGVIVANGEDDLIPGSVSPVF
ncbi:hypothetical protein ACG83_25980 [Frankia sp. R43]|uniref:hypothetical protein n=1 Tax=Frankia sp. R43 TaxID=269536 RepID=UPI0006CA5B9A|nr:hypothetical protein [Frankia sp. R43]KPM52885.1 hypothetical protein ACG83_25980 [Frankia sp. R43]